MNWKRVQAFGQMFYQLGDCGFNAAGRHGTPNQRMRSALWAYGLADAARPQASSCQRWVSTASSPRSTRS